MAYLSHPDSIARTAMLNALHQQLVERPAEECEMVREAAQTVEPASYQADVQSTN